MLYVIGTPIGNWDDMPSRNIDIIENSEYLVVENNEDYQLMVSEFDIQNSNCKVFYMPTDIPNKDEVEVETTKEVLQILLDGKDVCLISDNGMPAVADPGLNLINLAIKNNIKVSATPGPSSIIAAAVGAGCANRFSFESFFSVREEQRKKYIYTLLKEADPMIFMLRNAWNEFLPEILDILNDMCEIWGDRNGVLCYNLTTNKETFIRGKLSYLKKYHMENRSESDQVILVVDGIHPMLPMPKV